MPLALRLRPGDTVRIDEDITVTYEPIPNGGRDIKLKISARGHDVSRVEAADSVREHHRRRMAGQN